MQLGPFISLNGFISAANGELVFFFSGGHLKTETWPSMKNEPEKKKINVSKQNGETGYLSNKHIKYKTYTEKKQDRG